MLLLFLIFHIKIRSCCVNITQRFKYNFNYNNETKLKRANWNEQNCAVAFHILHTLVRKWFIFLKKWFIWYNSLSSRWVKWINGIIYSQLKQKRNGYSCIYINSLFLFSSTTLQQFSLNPFVKRTNKRMLQLSLVCFWDAHE